MICLWRFSIKFQRSFWFGYYDHKILDVRGFIVGWIVFGWWYDDAPEGLKSNGVSLLDYLY